MVVPPVLPNLHVLDTYLMTTTPRMKPRSRPILKKSKEDTETERIWHALQESLQMINVSSQGLLANDAVTSTLASSATTTTTTPRRKMNRRSRSKCTLPSANQSSVTRPLSRTEVLEETRRLSRSSSSTRNSSSSRPKSRRGLSARRAQHYNPENDGFFPLDESHIPPFRIKITTTDARKLIGKISLSDNWVTVITEPRVPSRRAVRSAIEGSEGIVQPLRGAASSGTESSATVTWPHQNQSTDADGNFHEASSLVSNWCGNDMSNEKRNGEVLDQDDPIQLKEFSTSLTPDFLQLFAH